MTKKVVTHDGAFHCDEALACFLLSRTDEFATMEVTRTRERDVIERMDCVVDVGGVYDEEKRRFDHHQRGFDDVFGYGFRTKLSSAGLVYRTFGKEVIARECDLAVTDPKCKKLWVLVYKHFMEAVDGIDNGVNQYDTEEAPRFLSDTNLSSRVGNLNPQWNADSSPAKQMEQFKKAQELAGKEFLESVHYFNDVFLPAQDIVVEGLENRFSVHPSGKAIQLSSRCPWKEHLCELEKEYDVKGEILYVIYPDDKGGYRIQCMSVSPGSFENRKSLPESWRGVREEALSQVVGIEGCVFCHASGFIAGNTTLQGALAMVHKALAA